MGRAHDEESRLQIGDRAVDREARRGSVLVLVGDRGGADRRDERAPLLIDSTTDKVTTFVGITSNAGSVFSILGMAVDETHNKLYALTNVFGNPNPQAIVGVVDGATNKMTASWSLAINPTGIAVDPTTQRVFVLGSNGGCIIGCGDGGVTEAAEVVTIDATNGTVGAPTTYPDNLAGFVVAIGNDNAAIGLFSSTNSVIALVDPSETFLPPNFVERPMTLPKYIIPSDDVAIPIAGYDYTNGASELVMFTSASNVVTVSGPYALPLEPLFPNVVVGSIVGALPLGAVNGQNFYATLAPDPTSGMLNGPPAVVNFDVSGGGVACAPSCAKALITGARPCHNGQGDLEFYNLQVCAVASCDVSCSGQFYGGGTGLNAACSSSLQASCATEYTACRSN